MDFIRFHKSHPFVFIRLKELALSFREMGSTRLSMKLLYEYLRLDGFKLSNNYHSRYARLLMQDPRLLGMFETRSIA